MRPVRRFRSAGCCHHLEIGLERAEHTFDKEVRGHAASRNPCPFCPPHAYEHRNRERQHRIRVQYLRAHRLKYKDRLSKKQKQIKTASERIESALHDLARLKVQLEQVESGTYNAERAFMTKRQLADDVRKSMQFRTTSVHAFGQSLDIRGAKSALSLNSNWHAKILRHFLKNWITF